MRKNVAGQQVSFFMPSSTDGSAVTTGTPVVYVTIDGGTQATGAGTSAHSGNGVWTYAPTQAETNGNHVSFIMTLTGAVSQAINVWPVSFDPTSSVDLGLTQLTTITNDIATAQADLDILTGTDGVTLATSQPNYAPNTVVPDPAGTAPTTTEIVSAFDSTSTQIAAIITDLDNTTDGLGALKLLIDGVRGIVDNLNKGIIYGSAVTGTLSTTQATVDLTGYTDNQLVNRYLVVTSGAADGEATLITAFDSATGTLTFNALTLAMANGDTFKVV